MVEWRLGLRLKLLAVRRFLSLGDTWKSSLIDDVFSSGGYSTSSRTSSGNISRLGADYISPATAPEPEHTHALALIKLIMEKKHLHSFQFWVQRRFFSTSPSICRASVRKVLSSKHPVFKDHRVFPLTGAKGKLIRPLMDVSKPGVMGLVFVE